jgi:hypothetical protein
MHKLLSILVVASLSFACGGGGKHMWLAQAQPGPITVQPQEVWAHGHKLWVRCSVVNNSAQPVLVDRDQIVARLPNGAVIHRAQGAYTQHMPYALPPGAGHEVYVEFAEEGFSWRDVPNAQIDFTPGVTMNGQPVATPALVVTNQP